MRLQQVELAGLAGAHSGSVGEPVILDATEDFGAVVAAQDDALWLTASPAPESQAGQKKIPSSHGRERDLQGGLREQSYIFQL